MARLENILCRVAFPVIAAALTIVASHPGNAQAPTPAVTGVWIDHTGQGAVEIHPCGQNMCGRIAWLKEPLDKKGGGPAKDAKGRPMCGLQIIGDLKPQANGAWENGWIYNPEEGQTFSAEIKLQSRDALLVTGYLGMKWLGEDFVWKRAPPTLGSCTTATARPS
jgi:uncharacterized protein (DUF2147 family)